MKLRRVTRNQSFVGLAVSISVAVVGLFCTLSSGHTTARSQTTLVRLAVVHTPEDSGLLAELLPDFEKQTGYKIQIDSREAVYDLAQEGKADLVISHYGHSGVEPFITAGLGLWPRAVFANQAALLGPAHDPARIHGLPDAVEAFRRIAESQSLFLLNTSPSEKYIAEVLWEGAGRPDRGEWYIDNGLRAEEAVEVAARKGAYTLWGLVPFLKFRERSEVDMEALLLNDPLFQRIMVSVVVNPKKIAGVNAEGAAALQRFLITPRTQARIRTFRYPGLDHQMWWPAGRNNDGASLIGR